MTRLPVPLSTIAAALDVDLADLEIVATVELTGAADYDPETATVSNTGRDLLTVHFQGGSDPD